MASTRSLTVTTCTSPRGSNVRSASRENLFLRSPIHHPPSALPGGKDHSLHSSTTKPPKPAVVVVTTTPTPADDDNGDRFLRPVAKPLGVSPGGKNLIRHRTPSVSSNVEYPLKADVVHENIQEKPHAFRAPTVTDKRAPCPALNTLANHGYLPRNGEMITRKQLLTALTHPDTYHLSWILAEVLVQGGFIMMKRFRSQTLSLHDLAIHGLIEHDASLVHDNTLPDHVYAPIKCDTVLLHKLLVSDHLTLGKVASRRTEMEQATPLGHLAQTIARGEWALVLGIFGKKHGVPADAMRVWLRENRFPEGWKPSHEHCLWMTVWIAFKMWFLMMLQKVWGHTLS